LGALGSTPSGEAKLTCFGLASGCMGVPSLLGPRWSILPRRRRFGLVLRPSPWPSSMRSSRRDLFFSVRLCYLLSTSRRTLGSSESPQSSPSLRSLCWDPFSSIRPRDDGSTLCRTLGSSEIPLRTRRRDSVSITSWSFWPSSVSSSRRGLSSSVRLCRALGSSGTSLSSPFLRTRRWDPSSSTRPLDL
jgi:hypothetical protein